MQACLSVLVVLQGLTNEISMFLCVSQLRGNSLSIQRKIAYWCAQLWTIVDLIRQ